MRHSHQQSRQHSRQHSRRRARWVAGATALSVPLALLGGGAAHATPEPTDPATPDGEVILRQAALVDLAPGARDVQVDESPFGGSVAVTWTVRNGSGRDEVWARVKDEQRWGAKVRVSDPAASATRPTMDLDSDGSLLVGWSEQRGSTRSLVVRRVTGGSAGSRTVFPVATGDGPYVAAGALHDVVAWSAPQGGVVRPFAAVDTGGGFAAPTVISNPGWKYDVLPGTLTVNADARQAHALYLSKDSDVGWAQTSWSVLDSTAGSSWVATDDLGPRQELSEKAQRPLLVTDSRDLAVIVVHDTDEFNVRHPQAQIFDPILPGGIRERVTEFRSIEVLDAGSSREVRSVHNRQDVLFASYTGPAFTKRLTLPTSREFEFLGLSADAGCTPFEEWFQVGVIDPTVVCLDAESTPGSIDLVDNGLGVLSTVRPGQDLPTARVEGTVPDPMIPLVVLTEDVAGTNDPVWLLDHTPGGSDKASPLLRFTKLKHPKITGKPVVGKKFKAVTGKWRPAPAEVAYRWFVNGKIVKGATKRTFPLKKAHRGKRVSVRLYLSRAGFADTVVEAKRPAKIKPKPKKKKKR